MKTFLLTRTKSLSAFTLLIVLFLLGSQATAATFTSKGGTAGSPLNWNDPTTWTKTNPRGSSNIIPSAADEVFILQNHNVFIAGPATADAVDISGTLLISAAATDAITFNSIQKATTTPGTMTIQTGNLRIENEFSLVNLAVTVNSSSSAITFGGKNPILRSNPALPTEYITLNNKAKLIMENIGKCGSVKRQDDVLFPIGTDDSYTPAFINNKDLSPSATTLGNFSVTVSSGVFLNGADGDIVANAVNKTWEVQLIGTGSTAFATFTFQWNSSDELIDFTLSTGTLAEFNPISNKWVFPTNVALDQVNRTLTITGLNSNVPVNFPKYAVMDGPVTPLPVELVYFNAIKKNSEVALTWETASEKNSRGFEVQTSTDGKNYEALGFVASQHGSATKRYAFAHKTTNREGLIYYRLKQIDLDGTFAYYQAKVIDLGRFHHSVATYPNPFQDAFKVNLEAITAQPAEIVVTDMTGKTIFNTHHDLQKGANTLEIILKDQPAGLYLLKTITGDQTYTNRLVKH